MSETKHGESVQDLAVLDTVSRLYLGRRTPDGMVTDGQADTFESAVISTLFPDGYTRTDARGAWMDQDTGATIHEPSVIIELAHNHNDTRVQELARAWKATFAQQSVLIASHPATVQFI